jgi:hypothetical protein
MGRISDTRDSAVWEVLPTLKVLLSKIEDSR